MNKEEEDYIDKCIKELKKPLGSYIQMPLPPENKDKD